MRDAGCGMWDVGCTDGGGICNASAPRGLCRCVRLRLVGRLGRGAIHRRKLFGQHPHARREGRSGADGGADGGKWVVCFTADGRYEVLQDGGPPVTGTFVQSGDRITLNDDGGDYACRGLNATEGVYKVSLAGSLLTISKVKDEGCPGRVATLTARPFHIVK